MVRKPNYTSAQLKAIRLKNEAVKEIPKLESFFHGRIPNFDHYKKLNMSRKRAIEIASYGFIRALHDLNIKLYFTQALLYGAAVMGTHHNIGVIFPSQYGKSFTSAAIATTLAAEKEVVSVAGNDADITTKIMTEVRNILPLLSEEYKKKLTTPLDKFEKMQVGLAKDNIGFVGGGVIQGITLGGKFGGSTTGNKAVGQSGNNIIDESALVPDANYSETGRSEVGRRKDGKPYLSLEISNPHNTNHFYRLMSDEYIPKGTLIIWADIRIAIEEGKITYSELDESAPEFESTRFFKNESTCIRYLLCEFGSNEGKNFFMIRPTIDNSPIRLEEGEYALGLDAATRGADAVMGALVKFPTTETPMLRAVDMVNFKPDEWVDFETPKLIVELVIALCKKVNIKVIMVDLGGQGELLYNDLGNRIEQEKLDVFVKGIMFHNSPTKQRIRDKFDIESGEANGAELAINKRAEMYIDLRELIQTKAVSMTQKVFDLVHPEMLAIGTEKFTSAGKIQLENKETVIKPRLGHSPDSLDALVMAIHGFLLFRLGLIGKQVLQIY